MLSNSEKKVLLAAATFLDTRRNDGWVGYQDPIPLSAYSLSTDVMRSLEIDAIKRFAAMGLFEIKKGAVDPFCYYRLKTIRAVEILSSDPHLFPKGDQVQMLELQERGVLVEYDPQEDYAYSIVLDGQRKPSTYRLSEFANVK